MQYLNDLEWQVQQIALQKSLSHLRIEILPAIYSHDCFVLSVFCIVFRWGDPVKHYAALATLRVGGKAFPLNSWFVKRSCEANKLNIVYKLIPVVSDVQLLCLR